MKKGHRRRQMERRPPGILEDQGESKMDFQKMTDYLDQLHAQNIPGCNLRIYRDHELLYSHSAGHSDVDGKIPMKGDETYSLYSCTKVITTCAAMQLIEAGKLHLDDPVYAYLPAYAHVNPGGLWRRGLPQEYPRNHRGIQGLQGGVHLPRCDDHPRQRREGEAGGGNRPGRGIRILKAAAQSDRWRYCHEDHRLSHASLPEGIGEPALLPQRRPA